MPVMVWHYILLMLFGITSVRAEGWEDFANNFAADLVFAQFFLHIILLPFALTLGFPSRHPSSLSLASD
jgi:hypothetical protein